MKKSGAAAVLKELIRVKETEQYQEGKLLKDHFLLTYEGLKPINIIKGTLKEAISMPELGKNLINTAIGVATGFAAKKILIGTSHNPFSKLFGVILEIIVASTVTKNSEAIRSAGGYILKDIFQKGTRDPEKST